MIASVESSLKDALDALSEDIEKYLTEAEEWGKKGTSKKGYDSTKRPDDPDAPKLNLLEPFSALGSAFFSPFKGLTKGSSSKQEIEKEKRLMQERKRAEGQYGWRVWNTYKLYKKSHRLITW